MTTCSFLESNNLETTPKTWSLLGWWFQIFFYFHPYLAISTNILQLSWNHQNSSGHFFVSEKFVLKSEDVDITGWMDVEWCLFFLILRNGFPHLSFEKRSTLKKDGIGEKKTSEVFTLTISLSLYNFSLGLLHGVGIFIPPFKGWSPFPISHVARSRSLFDVCQVISVFWVVVFLFYIVSWHFLPAFFLGHSCRWKKHVTSWHRLKLSWFRGVFESLPYRGFLLDFFQQ